MVEVFKTNVMHEHQAKFLLELICKNFRNYLANFDLEDCDKILRVECCNKIDSSSLIKLLRQHHINIEILEDTIPNK